MNTGILGYGVYIPKYRLKTSEISPVWGKESLDIQKSLGVTEKSVAAYDEDAVTLAYEAASRALESSKVMPSEIGACFVGSESHPYAVNPTSTIVGEFLGFGRNYIASDLQFACKAGTTGMIAVSALISAGKIKKGITIGTDKAQAKPHDILEYTSASGACAFVLGEEINAIAQIIDFTSYSSDTPDFWRRDGVRFPSHSGRFTGEPAYFDHVVGSSKALLSKCGLKTEDFDYCVFHMPNGKFPREAARRLGFIASQLAPSLIIDLIGNPYSASSLTGLSAVLDIALPNKLIFLVSYGSGAGSDAFILKTTKKITDFQNHHEGFRKLVADKEYISYVNYLKNTRKI